MNQKQQKEVCIFRVVLESRPGQAKRYPYREIAVLGTQSLSTFARAIVNSFGFDFDHCYGFYNNLKNTYKSDELYELFTDIGEDPNPGAFGVEHTPVKKAFSRIGKTMRFLFDYGDGWQFTVTLNHIQPANRNVKYPKVIKSAGEAPEQYPEIEENDEEDEDFYFDDCAVCQGMKKAEKESKSLSLEELKALFDKQNKLN